MTLIIALLALVDLAVVGFACWCADALPRGVARAINRLKKEHTQ